jgi:hypothetical protein
MKDVIMPDHFPQAELFNKYLKGRYAYWVQMRYIVPFEFMRHEGYVACEEDINKLLPNKHGVYPKPYGVPSLDVYDDNIIAFINQAETDRINSIIEYRMENKYIADEDITIDELKKFRTWLASEILSIDKSNIGLHTLTVLTEQEVYMLEYYSNGMYDNTIKILSMFGQPSVSVNTSSTKCSCCQSSFNVYPGDIQACNPIEEYKRNMYLYMVSVFSQMDFWNRFPKIFLKSFKKYIDNIIQTRLPLYSQSIELFGDCSCVSNNKQAELEDILKRLSTSLQYLINSDVTGHKNYISDALNDWSSLLYESMEW